MKHLKIIWILLLFLSACKPAPEPQPAVEDMPAIALDQHIPTPSLMPTPILPPVLEGDIEIQQLMLTSHNRWKNLEASYTMTQFPSKDSSAGPDITNHQIVISLPASFRVMISSAGDDEVSTRISDGNTVVDSIGERSAMPGYVFEAFNPPDYPSDTVYPHPLAGYLGTPVSDLIFPAALAQRGGIYNQTGEEVVAGRQAAVVEWGREPGILIDRFWVDKQTGLILRQQNYGKEQSASPILDIEATYIAFDGEISPAAYDLGQVPTPPPTAELPEPGTASITVLELEGILNVRSGPNTGYKVIKTIEPGETFPVIGRNEAGEWWKIDLGDQVGWVFGAFVEFTGDLEMVPITDY